MDLLGPLWRELGIADALTAAGHPADRQRAVLDAVVLVATALATGARPVGVETADAVDHRGVCAAMDRAAVRASGTELVLVGPVAAARGHLHGDRDQVHHCRLRRAWPGPYADSDALLSMAAGGRPQVVGPASSTIGRAAATALCSGALGEGVDLAGEHLRDSSSRRRPPASWISGGAGLAVQPSVALADGPGWTFLVRSERHARREQACREEVVGWLRTAIARNGSALRYLLQNSPPARWVDFSGTNPRLKEKAIADDAAFDGCYRLTTTVDRPDAELAAAYLRFHDVAADAERLLTLCPPSGQAAVGPALLLVHEVERRSDRPWRDIVAAMDGRYEVAADDGHIWRTPPTAVQEDILGAVQGPAR